MNKNIKFKRQMESTLNSRESKLRKKSYTLEIICLHYFILDESSFFFRNEWLSACKDLISFHPNIILYCVWLEQIGHELFLGHQGTFCYIAIKTLKRVFLFILINLDSLPYLCFVSSNWPSCSRNADDVKR